MLQVEVHPFFTQEKVSAYSPLVNGRSGILEDPVLMGIAKKYGKSTAQTTIRWHIQRGVALFPKSVFPNEIKENAKVFDFRYFSKSFHRKIFLFFNV